MILKWDRLIIFNYFEYLKVLLLKSKVGDM